MIVLTITIIMENVRHESRDKYVTANLLRFPILLLLPPDLFVEDI